MPPLPTLPGVHYGRVVGTWEGLPSTNILSFQVSPAAVLQPDDTADAAAVALALATHWPTFVAAVFPAQYTASEAVVYPLGHPTAPAVTHAMAAAGIPGTTPSTGHTAALVKHTVYRRGKGSQSRTFLTPVNSVVVTADGLSLTAGAVAGIALDWNNMLLAILNDLNAYRPGWTYVQVSKKGTGASYPITGSNVEVPLSTQRRRVRRSG
jgi:hypothetical protein